MSPSQSIGARAADVEGRSDERSNWLGLTNPVPGGVVSRTGMAKVLTHMCMSLDGFVAQPDDNPAEVFDWHWIGDVVVPSAQET